MVIWITGLSASGKTSLAKYYKKYMKQWNYDFILVDGDNIRDIFLNDLGFDTKARFKQISRMQKIAKFLDKQKYNVIVAALYSHPKLLSRNRRLFKNYFEIYLKANIEFLAKREIKKIYKKAINKKIKNVVGIDIKWHEPKKSHLVFEQKKKIQLESMCNLINQKIEKKKLYNAKH
jgi:adenylylsulfate kinase-like enzyme